MRRFEKFFLGGRTLAIYDEIKMYSDGNDIVTEVTISLFLVKVIYGMSNHEGARFFLKEGVFRGFIFNGSGTAVEIK